MGAFATTTSPVINKPKPAKPTQVKRDAIYVVPDSIKQGEPALIIVNGLATTTNIKSFTFDNRPLVFFLYKNQVTALLGVDLRAVPGTYPVVLTFKDGKELTTNFVIHKRETIQAPFDIPAIQTPRSSADPAHDGHSNCQTRSSDGIGSPIEGRCERKPE